MSSRPQTGMARPGTASRGGFQAGNLPMGGGRMAGVAGQGVPSTSYGSLAGNQAMGRAVQDRNYYLGLVRGKAGDLTNEMEAMRREIAQIEQDQKESVALQKKQEDLQMEVQRMQGMLADHNVLLGKLRTTPDVSVSDLKAEAERLAQANQSDQQKADALFSERTAKDRATAETERQITDVREKFQQELARMGEEKRKQYLQQKQENEELQKQVKDQRNQLEQLQSEAARLESQMKGEPNRQKALGIYEEIHKLRKKRDQLQAEISAASQLSIPEERERLVQHIKLTNQAIAGLTRQAAENEQEMQSLRQQMEQMDVESQETPENQAKREKLAETRKKDIELSGFLAKAPEMRTEASQAKTKLELTILALLEHLSKRILSGEAAAELGAAASKQKELHEEVDAKEELVVQGEQTHEKLQEVLDQRKAELQKLETMDQKLTSEIDQVRDKTQQLKMELETFKNIGQLRDDMEKKRQGLAEAKAAMVRQKEVVAIEAASIEGVVEDETKRQTDDDLYSQLDVLEKQLRHQEQNVFAMREYVESKTAECDYKPTSADVSSLTVEINDLTCKAAAASVF